MYIFHRNEWRVPKHFHNWLQLNSFSSFNSPQRFSIFYWSVLLTLSLYSSISLNLSFFLFLTPFVLLFHTSSIHFIFYHLCMYACISVKHLKLFLSFVYLSHSLSLLPLSLTPYLTSVPHPSVCLSICYACVRISFRKCSFVWLFHFSVREQKSISMCLISWSVMKWKRSSPKLHWSCSRHMHWRPSHHPSSPSPGV